MTAHGKGLDIFNKFTFLINQTDKGNKCILNQNHILKSIERKREGRERSDTLVNRFGLNKKARPNTWKDYPIIGFALAMEERRRAAQVPESNHGYPRNIPSGASFAFGDVVISFSAGIKGRSWPCASGLLSSVTTNRRRIDSRN